MLSCTFYFIAHFILFEFLFFFFIPIFMYTLLCFVTYNCAVYGADLTYISLLVIFFIIVYVMKKMLNLGQI